MENIEKVPVGIEKMSVNLDTIAGHLQRVKERMQMKAYDIGPSPYGVWQSSAEEDIQWMISSIEEGIKLGWEVNNYSSYIDTEGNRTPPEQKAYQDGRHHKEKEMVGRIEQWMDISEQLVEVVNTATYVIEEGPLKDDMEKVLNEYENLRK